VLKRSSLARFVFFVANAHAGTCILHFES
jgi:hypothetical protein